MTERRKYLRLEIALGAEVCSPEGRRFRGRLRNVSFGGAFVEMAYPPDIEEGDHVVLVILLERGVEVTPVHVPSRIVRTAPEGLGFAFVEIRIEDYRHFEQLMVYNSPDPEGLLEELRHDPGLVLENDEI